MPKNINYEQIELKIIERISKFDYPHRSTDRYGFITTDDEPGEFIELNNLLRNTRIMPRVARKRNFELVKNFDKFSREQTYIDKSKWRFWNIRPKSGKSDAANLRSALAEFNADINRNFTAIRARTNKGFEVLLLCIHIDYSHLYDNFDLHAHFICKIDPNYYDDIYKKIHIEFSEEDTSDDLIRNPTASANYAISGTIKHEAMIEWPDDAFEAFCDLFISKKSDYYAPRLIRPCGSFKAWLRDRRDRRVLDPAERAERARKAANRKETADPRRLERVGCQVIKQVKRFWVPASGRYRSGVLVRLLSHPSSGSTKPDTPIRASKSSANYTAIQRASFGVIGALSHHAKRRLWWWRTWPYGRTYHKPPRPIRRRLARAK